MLPDYGTGIGIFKNKLLDAWRFQHRHRELQGQASRCLVIPTEASRISKTSIPMPCDSSRGTGNCKNKLPDVFRFQQMHRKFQKQASRCLPVTADASGISRASISMPGDSSRGTGNSKNKLPDAFRFQQRHRELQKQASRCLPIPADAPEISKTSISMPSGHSRGTGNFKNKHPDAWRFQHRHRELQGQASRCLPVIAEASEIAKTSISMPGDLSRGTGNFKDKHPDAWRFQHRHREFQKRASRCLAI